MILSETPVVVVYLLGYVYQNHSWWESRECWVARNQLAEHYASVGRKENKQTIDIHGSLINTVAPQIQYWV